MAGAFNKMMKGSNKAKRRQSSGEGSGVCLVVGPGWGVMVAAAEGAEISL